MQQAEAELKVQIDALLERAKSTDEVEADKPDLDIPAEIARRATPLKAITGAMPTSSAGAVRTTTAYRTTSTPPAGASSLISACPIRRRRTTAKTATATS